MNDPDMKQTQDAIRNVKQQDKIKEEANEAFKAGNHEEAMKKYEKIDLSTDLLIFGACGAAMQRQ